MEDMIQKRVVKTLELSDEEPVLLLIISEGGTRLFSNSFSEDWDFEEDLVSNFLTAFNSFSEELFSEGFDRAKLGQYTVLMESVANFFVCYLFKGQTYLASQKLTRFSERIQSTTSIWQTLERFHNTSQVLELKDSSPLKSLISDIFTKRSNEIIV